MATTVRPIRDRAPSAAAIRDVCARPAVLTALACAVPAGAITSAADRQRAVADGVARALEAAIAVEEGREPDRRDAILLEEAVERMWEPVPGELARLLPRVGSEGLLAYLLVDGAIRREAWRADTQRRRAQRHDPLPPDLASADERDPIDLVRFRLDVERAVDATAQRTGLADDVAYGIVASELSYAEAGRRTGRTPNGLWMAMARLRPEWRGVAERGRAAGLGGGILIRVTDRTEVAVRRAIRWRLVGGTAAALLLAGALGAALAASWLEGSAPTARPPVEPAVEVGGGSGAGEGPYGPIGRILAIEAAARLMRDDTPPAAAPRSGGRGAAARADAAVDSGQTGSGAGAPAASSAIDGSCGLGSAALACR